MKKLSASSNELFRMLQISCVKVTLTSIVTLQLIHHVIHIHTVQILIMQPNTLSMDFTDIIIIVILFLKEYTKKCITFKISLRTI